jgi:hypothetical protein
MATATAELTTRKTQTQVLRVAVPYTGDQDTSPNPDVNKNVAALLRKAADELESLDGNRFEATGIEFYCDPDMDPEMVLTIDLYDDQQ